MTSRLIVIQLLVFSIVVGGCHSYTRFRPKADTIDARMAAQECIASCKASDSDGKKYYKCLDSCPGLAEHEGKCQPQMDICEQAKNFEAGKTATVAGIGVLTVVLIAVGVVAVGILALAAAVGRGD